jgi:hypothetical protein
MVGDGVRFLGFSGGDGGVFACFRALIMVYYGACLTCDCKR